MPLVFHLGQWDPRLGHKNFTILVAIKLFFNKCQIFSKSIARNAKSTIILFDIIIECLKAWWCNAPKSSAKLLFFVLTSITRISRDF